VKSHSVAPVIRFSVVVPAFNAQISLAGCLKALQEQSIPPSDYEVIVVDDGSMDDASKIAGGFDVTYIRQTHRGPAAARNRGVSEAAGEIVLFTDADCVPDRNWIHEMVLPFEDASVVGVKGAYRTQQRRLAARFAQAEFEDRYDRLERHGSIDMVDTYSAAYKRNLFQEMGGFDERFTSANNEDTDFSYRLARAGHTLVFTRKAFVYHTHPDTLGKYLRLKFWRGYWRMVVYRRYPEKAFKDAYTPQVIKMQALLAASAIFLLPFSCFVPGFLWPGLLCCAAILLSSLPFCLKVSRKDKAAAWVSPVFVFLRAFAFGVGSLFGLVGWALKP
jgi:cellulose synthase/poly-beta-1,6-N-acetylglucosamine synthase-like glycosyltransferase